MSAEKRIGRTLGVLLLAQMTAAFVVNSLLLGPVITTPPGYMANAAASSLQVSLSVVLGLATGAMSLGMAIVAMPVFRQYSQAIATWFVALSAVGLALTAVENMTVMSMLSLSKAYATAGADNAALFEVLRGVVGSARNWAHYINLTISGGMLLVLYGALFRFALVPRVLAGFGLAAVLLQLVAVTLPLFGQKIVFLLLMPLALAHLLLALWLIVKGLATQSPATPGAMT
ncbi:MAG: DUF4386 domain-containing protein [Steroidobacteraceae bacterium]